MPYQQYEWTAIAPWLTLFLVPGIGPRRFYQLLEKMGTPENVLAANPSSLTGLPKESVEGLRQLQKHSGEIYSAIQQQLEDTYLWFEKPHHYIIPFQTSLYPKLLQELVDAPPLLFVNGQLEFLSLKQIAVVGSRNPSNQGQENAYSFAAELSSRGYVVTSGLAYGVDAAAHQGALASGGATIAVLGTGLDVVYPARHKALAERISERGALISDFPLSTKPQSSNFPRRNRLISGLSTGVLVVEATLNSGSLITARLAAEQGRDVFAIPGSIHNPLSKGCHELIRQGAKLVDQVDHIVEEVRRQTPPNVQHIDFENNEASAKTFEPELNAEQQSVMEALEDTTCHIDQIVLRTTLNVQQVADALLHLELSGFIESVPGGYRKRMKS
ncbi:DNA-processing protein DprA [Zooshikella sp. RANM57]|uniref:DNA-processing protein DprA n=1 Tax=Zooshikella sp. RANM57 TaxID=3425863 RepID=UPI003D6E0BCD